MRAKDFIQMAKTMFSIREPFLVLGPPGIGKSDLIALACRETDRELIISHPAVEDPVDSKGLGAIVKSEARFLPFGNLRQACTAKKPVVWFLDDFGQAVPAVQAAYMQLLLARRVDEHVLSDHVTFVLASNRVQDRAGAHRILTAVQSRTATEVTLDFNMDDWQLWAVEHEIHPMIRSYLRFRPDHAMTFNPDKGDGERQSNPRLWEKLSKIMKSGLPKHILHETCAGSVGKGVGAEFMVYCDQEENIPDMKQVLKDPDNYRIPEEPSLVFATIGALAEIVRARKEEVINKAMRYVSRFKHKAHQACAVRDFLVVHAGSFKEKEVSTWLEKNRHLMGLQ